jgi:hypothetical protein
MKSTKQEVENMEYVRRLLEQKQPGFAACLEFAASLLETSHGATSPFAPPDLARLRRRPPSCVVRQRGRWGLVVSLMRRADLEPAKFPSGDTRQRSRRSGGAEDGADPGA